MANPTNTAAGGPLIERLNQESAFADKATEAGLIDLANKVAPLIQGRRFHNVVDLLSLVADGVDMADDAMIQKMMSGYEDLVSNAWMLPMQSAMRPTRLGSSRCHPAWGCYVQQGMRMYVEGCIS